MRTRWVHYSPPLVKMSEILYTATVPGLVVTNFVHLMSAGSIPFVQPTASTSLLAQSMLQHAVSGNVICRSGSILTDSSGG